MKKALISPSEYILDATSNVLGMRIAEVCDVEFEVAEPLFWVDVQDEVTSDGNYWNGSAAVAKPVPVVETPPSQAGMGGMSIVG